MSKLYVKKDWAWRRYESTDIYIPETETLFWSDEFTGSSLNTANWGAMNATFASGNSESQLYRPANIEISAATVGGSGNSCKIISKQETISGLSISDAPQLSLGTYAAPMTELPAGTRYWTSGMMSTRDASPKRYFPLFGRYEMRARFPFGQGTLPAFWLRRAAFDDGTSGGASWGEVDIFEHFGSWKHGYAKYSMHFPNTIGVNATQQSIQVETPVPGSTTGWHTYDVQIRPKPLTPEHTDPLKCPIQFTAHLDGVQYASYLLEDELSIRDLHMIKRSTGEPGRNDNLSWDICVNNAVGGKWVGQPDQQLGYLPLVDKCSKNQGTPAGNDPMVCDSSGLFFVQFPCTYEIDYVRVYEYTWE